MRRKYTVLILAGVSLLTLALMIVGGISFFPRQANADEAIVTHQVVGPQVPVGQSGSVTATCASGEQLLSGGFSGNAFEGAVYINENYPSDSNAWTVTVNNTTAPSWVQLTVKVYCLKASYTIGSTVVHTTNTTTGLATAACPASSVLLGGGFAGTTRPATSAPNGNGWQSDATNVYAVCATTNLTAAPAASATFLTPTSFTTAGTSANCPTGQLNTGGGYSRSNAANPIVSSQAGTTGWSVSAAGTSGSQTTVTVWAVCVSTVSSGTPSTTPTTGTTPTITPTLAVSPTPTPVTSGCKVTYQVTSQWPGGFGASIQITNTGVTTLPNWSLTFKFANGQKITQLWNGVLSQVEDTVTIANASYNGNLAPGKTVNPAPGFNATWSTMNGTPTAFSLNGLPCVVG